MTTQEIKNMNLDKTQVSKMMLGSYQVWPHVEIDYGPEVPEIEGDYLAFATYGEADISFKACGVTRDYFSGQLDFNVIYSYDGITWNDFGYSYTLADEDEQHKVYTFDKVHITKDTPVYIKRSTPGTLLTPSYMSLLDETPLGLDNYDNGVYDIPMNPDNFIDEYGQTFSFTMSGDYVFCSGKLKAWMDLDLFNFDVRPWYADFPYFAQLFRGCTKLRTANIEFQFNYLWKNMYNCMFLDCTSLIAGPKIFDFSNIKYTFFDTERNDKEYVQDYRNAFWLMFAGCTSLIKTPQFVGEFKIREGCFGSMFKNCKSLIIPTSLKNISCFSSPDNAFMAMFKGCTSLIKIPELPNFSGYKLYNRTFEGCTSLKTVPILPATELASYCYERMFAGCTLLVTAPELPAATLKDYCYREMFEGCTSLTKAPKLPATTLAYYCYCGMFRNCASLKYVKMMATDIDYRRHSQNWLDGVSETGTFVKNIEATWSDSNGVIPEGWRVKTE